LRKLLTQEFACRVLPEGTPLRVVLSDRAAGLSHTPDKFHIKVAAQYLTGEHRRFVPVWIGPYAGSNSNIDSGGLWMRQIGFDRCELESSLIELPEEFEDIHAQSLNHAFTMLSERYETHRLSHTGNVYDRVFYQEANDEWYPLSTLRDGVRERSERAFLAAAWRQIEEQMGWCRLPVERKKKG
jgi:hypothetical protein